MKILNKNGLPYFISVLFASGVVIMFYRFNYLTECRVENPQP